MRSLRLGVTTGVAAITLVGTVALPAPSGAGGAAGGGDAVSATGRHVRTDVLLNFDRGRKRVGDVVRRTRNSGTAKVRAQVVTAFGGKARRARGRYSPWALRLPRFDDGSEPPRATVRVTSRRRDPLSPRNRDFVIGIDFWLNGASSGESADDGDNLLQRGGYRARSQYKLQADDAIPLCRVKGDAGALLVMAEPVSRRHWHRMRCVRSESDLTLTVWRLEPDGPVLLSQTSTSGETGDVDAERGVPLAVGGRLRKNGTIPARAGDQFNGLVDRVVYDRR